jgi:hypothetical protein
MRIILKEIILVNFKSVLILLSFILAFTTSLSSQIAECPPSVILPCEKVNMNPQVYFEMDNPFFRTGDNISIQLKAEKFEFVNTLQFTLSYNSCHLNYLSTQNGTLKDFVINEVSSDNGNIAIIWFNSSGKGICTEQNATLLNFQFEVLDANVDDNSITLTNNISEMEAGVTLDINAPTCSMDIDVDKFYLPNVCMDLSTTINLCNPELNDNFAVIDISVCGGTAPYTISSNGFQSFQTNDFESTNVLIDDVNPNQDVEIVITDSEGTQLDTSIQFAFVNPMEVSYTVIEPSCINSSDGSIIIDSITGGIKDDLTNYEIKWSNEVYSDFNNTTINNGDYSVTIIDQMGCELIENFTLDTESLTIDNLTIDNSCDDNGTVTFGITVPNPNDQIVQVLVRDQNFVNYPNELSGFELYENSNIPVGLYLITVFTQNGCSADTSFVLYKDFARIGGTLFVDENENAQLDEDVFLADVPITLFECDGDESMPLFNFNTTAEGNFAFIIPPGIYKFGIHRDEFLEGGKLAQFDIPQSAPSPQDDQDNDNNAYENNLNDDYALITDCVFVNCPENVTGESENEAIDLGLFRQKCESSSDINDHSQQSCDLLAQAAPICDLSDISGSCFTLNSSESIVSDITPICLENETLDNGSWFSFIAPNGDVQILISPLSCLQGRCGELGMHMGVFNDCDIMNPLWCSEGPCIPKELMTPQGLFTPGEQYYFFVDGCGGAVCDFEVLTICNDPSCDPYSGIDGVQDLTTSSCNKSQEFCVNKEVQFELPANFSGDIEFEWTIFNEIGGIVDFTTTSLNSLNYSFPEEGSYGVCVSVNDACGSEERCMDVAIVSPEIIEFPTQSICGGTSILPSFTDMDGNVLTWPSDIVIDKNLSDVVQELVIIDTLETECNCDNIFQISIEVQPDSSSVIDSLICTATSTSVQFDWLQDLNTSQYQITILTGQSGVFNPLDPSFSVSGLSLNDTVEIEILAINNTGCGENAILSASCVADGTSTDELIPSEIKLYPVPTEDLLYINTDLQLNRYFLFTKEGKLLRSSELQDAIDVSDLQAGIYMLGLEKKEGQMVFHRFIKL